MGAWSIYGKNGQVKATVKKLEYNGEFMGERSITCTLYSPSPISLESGDYITYRGEVFSIDYDPSILKQARRDTSGDGFVYEGIKMNSLQMELVYCKFLDYVMYDNQIHYSSLPNFSFYCETILNLTERIQANLNRLYTGGNAWTIVVNTQNVSVGRINIDVQGMTCWDALALVAEKFNSTFVIRGRTITVAPSTNILDGLFQYGKGNGLRSIARTTDPSQGVVTRLRAMGNTTNMPMNYYRNKDMYVYAPITEVLGPYETSADIHTTYDFNNCFTVRASTSSDIQYRTKVSLDKTNWAPAIFSANPAWVGYSVASVMQLEGYDPVQYAAFMQQLNTGTYTKLYFSTGISKDKWPSSYKEYTGTLGVTTGDTRLMLPGYPDVTSDPYIDSEHISRYGIREESVIFDGSNGLDDIYPTIQGMTAEQARAAGATINLDTGDNGHLDEIVSATQIDDDGVIPAEGEDKQMAETFNITLKDIGFNINDYLSADNATISMRDGKCEGREFEITKVEKSGNKYVLTCNRQRDDSLNRYFPYDDYNLTAGDKFVLLNIEMPELYIGAASQRLQDAAEAYLATIDHSIFTIEPKIDNIKAKRLDDEVEASGEGVKVYDTIYEGMLMQIEDEDLDIDDAIFIDRLTIREGDSLIPQYEVVLRNEKMQTTVQQIQQQITDIKTGAVSVNGVGAVDASQVNQLIKNYGDNRYLSKVNNDRAKGKITFEKGLQIGPNFASGIAGGVGGNIDQNANAELESLVLRRFLQVPELRYNRVMVELGDKWNAPGAGIIEEVTQTSATTGSCKLKLEDGEIGAVFQNAICMGIFHSEGSPEMNATADSDDSYGNFEFAGFYTCYFRITSVSNAEGKTNNQYFTYALRPTDGTGGSWNKSWHPSVGMHFVCYGIFADFSLYPELKSYGCSQYQTKTYTRLLYNQNTWEISASNIAMQWGDMTNMSAHQIDMDGYSVYLNNVYFTGTIRQVDAQGHTIMTANDRGAYVAGTSYAYYDRVSTDKGLWLCVNENGTNTAPSASNSDWLLQVPAGESLNPEGAWDISKVPYAYNSVVTYADRVWVANKDTSDVPYDTVHDTQSPDWDLLIDISGITDGEDGASLEVQYSADGTNWHTTFASTDIYMRQRVGDGAWSGAIRVVGEAGQDGDYKDFQFAKNTSTTTAPSSGWQDSPPTVNNGEYLWMRVRWVYGDGRQPSSWTVTRIKGDKGDEGESPLFLDFDNEYIQVACVSGTSYKADGAQTKYSGLTLFYGTHSCALTSILINGSSSYSQNGINITTDYSTSTITFAISDQAIVSERAFEFTVTGTYNGQTYTQTGKVKLRGIPAAADGSPAVLYELEPSVNVIAKYKDDTLSISTISCKVIKFVGSNRTETDEKTLRYQIDNGSITTINNRSTWTAQTSGITQHITFYLYDENVLIDKERVPLVTDGKDGAGFALAGAWDSTHGTYTKMSVVSMGGASFVAMNDTTNPPMWCYKLSDGSYAKLSDGGYVLTGEENTTDWEKLTAAPNAPLDSISDEFIFKNALEKPSKPTSENSDDYVPTGWTDDPVGVSISFPTEWVCKRTRRNGVWGEYSDPAVFAQFGKDGNFKSRVFKRTNNAPETPTGGTYDNPIPSGWEDGVPQGTAILWSSVCTFSADGTSSGWSTPAPETDTDTLDIEFSPNVTEPAAPSGSTPYADHESEGWYDPSSPNFAGKDFIWRAERKVSNGVYDGAWTITRIKGEKGDSNVIADIDNEVQSIACTSAGKATKAYTLTTTVSMWYGLTELTLSNVTWNTISGITVSRSGKVLTFTIANNATVAEVNKFNLVVSAVYNGTTYLRNLLFTINGVRGGADGTPATIYDLIVSASSVKRDKSGTHTPSTISCTRQKTVGSSITNNTTDGTFTYSVNGGAEQSYSNNTAITIASTTNTIAFFLRVGGVLVDKETISVIEDGKDGAGFNHRGDWVSGMTLSTNDVVNMGGGTYVARHDGVTAAPLSSYLLSNGDRILLSDGGYALNGQLNITDYWVMVARPEDGADGTDFEFIFRLTATEDTKPSKPSSPQTDDYIPSGWTDDATGISETYRAEWFCMRKKENGIWGEYSDVALWSRYAEDGADGEDAIFADLDNEMDSVSVDDTGKTMAATVFNSNIWFAFGTEKVTPTSVSFSGQLSGVTCSHNNGLVTINVPSGTQMPVANDYKADITITLSATIGGNSITRNLVFTIKGVVGGVVYQLVPQYSLIRKSVSGSTVTLTPQTLNIQVRKIANGVPSLAGRNDVSVYATIDSGSRNEVIRGSSSEYWQLSLPTTMSKVFLEAVRKSDNVVFDSETIQVVEDGADGAPGSPGSAGRGITGVVRQFRISDSSTSLVGNYQWSTTVPERRTGTYIWARDVTNYDSGNPTYGTAFCASGDTGFNGCTVRTHQNGFEVGKTYVNQTNVASVDLRYMDVVITPTKHSAASGYDVYMCKATSTVYAAGDEDDTSKWEEVSQNEASAYFTYLIAKEANINVLSGASFTIQDANGDTSIIIDSGGITQVYTAADGVDASVVGQPKMVFGGGMITYYNTDGSKAWQIGSAAQFQTSTIDSWVQKKLLFLSSDRNTAIINIKTMTGTKVDAMSFSPGSNSTYNSYRGYTVPSGSTSQVPSSATAISNGYYTQYSAVPAQAIAEGGRTRYAVKMTRYTGGYITSTETVEWEE